MVELILVLLGIQGPTSMVIIHEIQVPIGHHFSFDRLFFCNFPVMLYVTNSNEE